MTKCCSNCGGTNLKYDSLGAEHPLDDEKWIECVDCGECMDLDKEDFYKYYNGGN